MATLQTGLYKFANLQKYATTLNQPGNQSCYPRQYPTPSCPAERRTLERSGATEKVLAVALRRGYGARATFPFEGFFGAASARAPPVSDIFF